MGGFYCAQTRKSPCFKRFCGFSLSLASAPERIKNPLKTAIQQEIILNARKKRPPMKIHKTVLSRKKAGI